MRAYSSWMVEEDENRDDETAMMRNMMQGVDSTMPSTVQIMNEATSLNLQLNNQKDPKSKAFKVCGGKIGIGDQEGWESKTEFNLEKIEGDLVRIMDLNRETYLYAEDLSICSKESEEFGEGFDSLTKWEMKNLDGNR